jgi:DNA primase small subunit
MPSMDNEGVDPTIAFLRGKYGEYYKRKEPVWPPRFGTREWAFFLWEGKGMFRHTAFLGPAKLRNFLGTNGPRHVYYSSAYYQKPAAPTMGQKGWLGADLIFDIDADHIKGAEKLTYHQMLDKVKDEIIKLVAEYLLRDLAFDEKYLQVVFSGGRGYHVHVHDPRVLELDSHERKEIVDYIMATDLDPERLYDKRTVAVSGLGPYQKVHQSIDLPAPDEGGWRGRFSNYVDKYLTELEKMEKDAALKKLQESEGIGKKMASDIYEVLFGGTMGKRGADKIRRDSTLEVFGNNEKARNLFAKVVINNIKGYAGEADAPVTKDINRLIRLPGSLHGKSSLRVVPLTLDEVYKFEPLIDAIAFGDEPLKVVVKKDLKFDIKGQDYDLKAGEATLPEHAAIFLMSRGEATLKVG